MVASDAAAAWLQWGLLGGAGVGTLLMLLAAWGNLTFPNAIARMHAAGLGSTLGILLLLTVTGLYFQFVDSQPNLLLLMAVLGFFLFITSPVATSAMARAAFTVAKSRERQFLGTNEYQASHPAPGPIASTGERSMHYVERLGSDSGKWGTYDADVIPLWVADMDFRSPQPILDALHARIDHGVFGYGGPEPELAAAFCQHLDDAYQWQVQPADLVFLPGLVCGLNAVTRAVGQPGSTVAVFEPVYPPFLRAPALQERQLQSIPLACAEADGFLRYEIDLAACRQALAPNAQLLLLCNPHNPVGRSFAARELQELAEFCLDRGLVLCSDEIHCELLLDDTRHVPVASLAPEIAFQTITLMAPSKTFNLPGLGCSVAIAQNPELRAALQQACAGIVPHVNVMGYVAAISAYGDPACRRWARELCRELTANRDYVTREIKARFPAARLTQPESTYLSWIDFGAYMDNPYRFFLRQAKVALGQGNHFFTQGGHSFARLNMGTSQALLGQALDRMQEACAQADKE